MELTKEDTDYIKSVVDSVVKKIDFSSVTRDELREFYENY